MKFCMPHWDGLKAAIDARGLTKFVSGSGEKLAEKLTEQAAGAPNSITTFDPLANACLGIYSNAIERGGMYLMGAGPDGSEYCPICESEKHNGSPASWWFDNAADEQLEKARAMGLMPAAVPVN